MTVGGRGHRVAIVCAFSLLSLMLWAFTHQYNGFMRDGQLYALQAMARIHPWLSSDIYLQNTSQDRYTIFSPLYAALIKVMGLQSAEMALYVVCTVWFLAAAWVLARKLTTTDEACFAVVLLIVTVGYYGAYGIFDYSESYLTARSLGEALTVTSLASYFSGRRWLASGVGVTALFVHPLMALPGALLLVCQWLPLRFTLILAPAGVLAVLGIAIAATLLPVSLPFLAVMDPLWLDVVRERSQFLFLNYWSWTDWEHTARPFVCLTLTALVIPDVRIRKFCITAMLVGFCGLIVALIAGGVGPVAILVQGQAWRWVWMTHFVSVLLLAPTMVRIWRDDPGGPLAALMLLLGWTYPALDGLACVEGVLVLWLLRSRIPATSTRYLRWLAAAGSAVVVMWVFANCWSFFHSPVAESGRDSLLIGRLRECFGLGISAPVFAWLAWYGVRKLRSAWTVSLACICFLAAVVWILPGSMKQQDRFGSPTDIREFEDWRSVIPPSSTVLMLPTGKSALLQWFTLERPGYLSVGQSAGVVFSRATAAEVVRRSTVLLPLEEPNWKILSSIEKSNSRSTESGSAQVKADSERPLTADSLVHVCGDPQLDFVIARQNVGFQPLQHKHPGMYKNWYLYDCRPIRSADHAG